MDLAWEAMRFIDGRFCYEAKSIQEANTLVIWGSLSSKLADTLGEQVETMVKNRFIIHMRGCELRIDNEHSSSSMANTLAINTVFSSCVMSDLDYRTLVNEARQCLRA